MENGFLAGFLPPGSHLPPPQAGLNIQTGRPGGGLPAPSPLPSPTVSAAAAAHLSSLAAAANRSPWSGPQAQTVGAFGGFPPPPSSAASRETPGLMLDPRHSGSPLFPHGGGQGAAAANPFLAEMEARQRAAAIAAAEAQRMAEIQRTLEASRKESAAAANKTYQPYNSGARESPLFSHGFSPLDRSGLYPSHGSILDPLSTSPAAAASTPRPSALFPSSSEGSLFRPQDSVHKPPKPKDDPSASSSLRQLQASEAFPSLAPSLTSLSTGNNIPNAFSIATNLVTTSNARPVSSSFVVPGLGSGFHVPRPEEPPAPVSDEEVLVDDFDGQCCRTYPYNHSRIQRWQKEKREKKRAQLAAMAEEEKKREKEKKQANKAENNVPPSGSIPVGIAIGRQRQQEAAVKEKELHRSGQSNGVQPGASSGASASKFEPLVPVCSRTNTPAVTPSVSAPSPWPPAASPHPLWNNLPGAPSPYPPGMAPWIPGAPGGLSPMGPIPMGYQLAKDPLTGQILLIPTEGGGGAPPQQPGAGLWPPPPGAGMLPPHYGHGVMPPPSPSANQREMAAYHHMYLQHQQQLQYLHAAQQAAATRDLHHHNSLLQASAMASACSAAMTGASAKRSEPETITVSDDDDESPPAASAKPLALVPEVKKAPESSTTTCRNGEDPFDKLLKTSPGSKPCNPAATLQSASSSVKPEKQKDLSLEDKLSSAEAQQQQQKKGEATLKRIKTEPPSLPLAAEAQKKEIDCPTPAKALPTDKAASNETQKEKEAPLVKIKSEPKDVTDDSVNVDSEACAETLLALASKATEFESKESIPIAGGLDVLLQGIEIANTRIEEEYQPTPFDFLCSVTQKDTIKFGIHERFLDVDLLCSVTLSDYYHQVTWVDPMVLLKQKYNLHKFKSPESEAICKEYVSAKIKHYEARKEFMDNHDGNGPAYFEEDQYEGIKSLAKVIKQIKNTDIMSQMEVDLRAQLVQLQTVYRERQRELARMKSTPKKKGSSANKRGPGRPKKRRLKSSKSKMGRPRKKPMLAASTTEYEDADEEDDDEEEDDVHSDEEEEEKEDDLSPPVLEPCGQTFSGHSNNRSSVGDLSSQNTSSSSGLLKPPTLTASLSPPPFNIQEKREQLDRNSVTNLSTLSAKFMRGRANPFANLMKLATVPGSAAPSQHSRSPSPSNNEEEEESEEEEKEVEVSDSDDESSSVNLAASPPPPALTPVTASKPQPAKRPIKEVFETEDNSASKKRKSEKPRKHTGSTETIVPKKPRNLFMMSLFKSSNGSNGSASGNSGTDQYEFNEDDEDVQEEDEEEEERTTSPPQASTSSSFNRKVGSSGNKLFGHFDDSGSSSTHTPTTSTGSSTTISARSTQPTAVFGAKAKLSPSPTWGQQKVTNTSKAQATVKAESTKDKKKSPKGKGKGKNSDKSKAIASGEKKDTKQEPKEESGLPDATLLPDDLGVTDNYKVLMLQEGRFWPSNVTLTTLPGVYNIEVLGTRSGKVIMAQMDIVNAAINEVRPTSKSQLPVGTRVCVYWSQAYNCLFPGTVEEEEEDMPVSAEMIQVLLDDGDQRQVNIKNVRMLPKNYNHVVYDPDPIATLRRRRISNDSVDSGSSDHKHFLQHLQQRPPQMAPLTLFTASASQMTPTKKQRTSPNSQAASQQPKEEKGKSKKPKKKHSPDCRHKKRKSTEDSDGSPSNLRIKLDGSFNNTTTYSIRSPMYQQRSEESAQDEEEEDSANESEETSSDEEGQSGASSKKPGINPVTGRPLWTWLQGDDGYRRPGSKGKAKKKFHRSIQRDSEVLNVGDCAVFLSTGGNKDRPYIGKLETLWETWNGNMMVKVKWFYHPEEIETTGKKFDLKIPGGLFQSPHTDENDVQTISHSCNVLPLKEYSRQILADPVKRKKLTSSKETPDTYYLAGTYDPTAMTVALNTGVFKQ